MREVKILSLFSTLLAQQSLSSPDHQAGYKYLSSLPPIPLFLSPFFLSLLRASLLSPLITITTTIISTISAISTTFTSSRLLLCSLRRPQKLSSRSPLSLLARYQTSPTLISNQQKTSLPRKLAEEPCQPRVDPSRLSLRVFVRVFDCFLCR